MTVKELTELLAGMPNQDQEVMVAYDSAIRMPIEVVTNGEADTDEVGKTQDVLVLTTNEENDHREQW